MANEVNGYFKFKDKNGNITTLYPMTKFENVKGLSENFATSSTVSALAGTVDKKVDKVSGKGLSSNDFTTSEKNKLAGIAEGANKITIDTFLSSSQNPIANNAVNSAITSLNTDLIIINNRIDTIAQLEDGSTTGDAELKDIRNGATGKVYSTAGDAVRNQIQNLNSNLINYTGFKEFNSGFEQGGIGATGNLITSTNYIRSTAYIDYIKKMYVKIGVAYIKIYKNAQFMGNYDGNGNINKSTNIPISGEIDTSKIWELDEEYKIKLVYTKTDPASTTPTSLCENIMYNVGDGVVDSMILEIDNETLKSRNLILSQYDFKTANITQQGEYTLHNDEGWVDLPDDIWKLNYAILMVYRYHKQYILQEIISGDLKIKKTRIVRISDGIIYKGWEKYNYTETGLHIFDTEELEQGGIGQSGNYIYSDRYVRSKEYIDNTITMIFTGSGYLYVKVYANDVFVGNFDGGSEILPGTNVPLKGLIDLNAIYKINTNYKVKLVYTKADPAIDTSITETISDTSYIINHSPMSNIVNTIISVEKSNLKGKKVSIYGDSISTFAGYIPAGNKAYYTGTNAGVTQVYQTWWMRTINALKAALHVNNSWSGRTVTNIRDTAEGMINSGAWRQSEVNKLGNGSAPDIIIIKLGVNDAKRGVPLGTYNGTTPLPSVESEGPDTFREAFAIMLDRVMTTYPLAKVYCCTLNDCECNGSTHFPEINEIGVALSEYNDAIKQLSAAFGAEIIDHAACGITHYNLANYMGDYSTSTEQGLHPNAAGMQLIADKTISVLS